MLISHGKKDLKLKVNLSSYAMFKKCKKAEFTLLPNQGYSNKNYSFKCKKSTYILREFILEDRNREAEFYIQSMASKQKIAATPYVLNKEEGYMISDYLEGEHRAELSRDDISSLVYAVKTCHLLTYKSEALNIKELFKVQSGDVKKAFNVIDAFPKELALCHNDLNPKNILFTPFGLKFIDWEFAAINDIYFDLAAISVEFKLEVIDEAYMLALYFMRDGWKKEKMEAYKVIYKELCKEWFEENI
jgi:aminoglycoside phosphotransferase (APT) family kinase protein